MKYTSEQSWQVPSVQDIDDDDSIDLRAAFRTLWRGKWIVLVCAGIGLVLGLLIASQTDPSYRATAKLLIGGSEVNVLRDGEGVVDEAGFGADTLLTHIELLGSSTLVNRVIDRLQLDAHPAFAPGTGAGGLAGLADAVHGWLTDRITLPPELEDQLRDIGLMGAQPQSLPQAEEQRRRRLELVRRVADHMSVEPVRGSRVIKVSYTSGDPRLSALVANEITRQYLADQLQGKLETTRSAVGWLSDRVEQLKIKVNAAERAVEEASARLSRETGQSIEITRQQMQAVAASLADVRNDLATREAQFARLNGAVAEGRDLGALTEFRQSAIITGFRSRETALMSQLAVFGEDDIAGHPVADRLKLQLGEVSRNIRQEAARILQALELDIEGLRASEANLAAELRALENMAGDQSRGAVEIRQLEREAQASRIVYENLLARLQESNAEESLLTADARVISPAEIPDAPRGTAVTRIKLLAGAVGLLTGVALVFLMDRLNNTFRVPAQLEEMSGKVLMGTIPQGGSRMQRHEVIGILRDKPSSALAEAIRNLRTSILFSNVDNPPQVIMFTSSVPREGKSTTSALMALTSRQMGKSAVIVDCDLRRPALGKVLHLDEGRAGLLSVINRTAPISEALHVDPDTGLHVLMTKASERNTRINAADVLASQRFRELINTLRKTYDIVILDTPPTLVVTDARIIAAMADAVIYAVRWDHTPRSAVLEGLRELTTVEAKITGLVMTMVNESRAARYSCDGYGYHKGRYREYYEA